MVLFVCTGNTCRSPMAAALARRMGIDAQSAGIAAQPGAPATPEARRAVLPLGAELSAHRARQVTPALMAQAERVYAMTEAHGEALRARYPAFAGKVFVLRPPIPDPYGGDDQVYAKCAQMILQALINLAR